MIKTNEEALNILNTELAHLKKGMDIKDDGFDVTIEKDCDDGIGCYELCQTNQIEPAAQLILYLWNNAEKLLSK